MFRYALVATLYLLAAGQSLGADETEVTGSIANIATGAWTITGLESNFELTSSGLSGEIRIAKLVLLGSGQVLDDIRIACVSIRLTTRTVQCAQATLVVAIPGIDRQSIRSAFTYDRYAGTADIELAGVVVAGGRVRFDIAATDSGFTVDYAGTQLLLDGLLEVASNFTNAFAEYSAGGLADVSGSVITLAGKPPHIDLSAILSGASLANDAGTVAADNVTGTLELDASLRPDTTEFTLAFTSNTGEAYLEPAYANFSENALALSAIDVVTPDFSVFEVPSFRLQQSALLDVAGSARLRFPTDAEPNTGIAADIVLRDSLIENLYTNVIKVAAAGTMFGDLETSGRLSGPVKILDSALHSARLSLNDVILDDRRGRFAVYELNGVVDWSAEKDPQPGISELSWESGTVYNIIIGEGAVDLQLGSDNVELLAPLRLPTLGGALLVNQLILKDFGSDDATGILDAELEPVQLGQLSGAFGWPAFSGRLSGRLPLLRLEENTITVGGTLSAHAFDGTLELSQLLIEQPFGRVPRMQGELVIRDLDLQHVTDAFSFGNIQGRLSGDVSGLKLENWRPVAMDMYFYTPANDKSKHRISQRAVENLASVGGGGAAAVLSTGFLKFFDVFAYDQIGLRCLLKDGVCSMSGVGRATSGPQGKGYYLVKGSGLPRIDVVGFRDTVSWPRLMQQLASITRGGAPTVN